MKKIITILHLFVFTAIYGNLCFSQQTIYYGYDEAGNRTSRTITLPLKSTSDTIDTDSSFFDDQTQQLIGEPDQKFLDHTGDMEVTIYPNPTRGELVVKLSGTELNNGSIYVYDLNGKLILTRNNLSEFTLVSLTNEPSGTYILRISVGDDMSEWKIIKE